MVAPRNQTVTKGSNLSLPCQVTGHPTPKVEWLKFDGKMPEVRSSVTLENTLHLRNVSTHDSGNYACIASNEAGSIKAEVLVTVLAPPYFQEVQGDEVWQVGGTVQLICSIEGDPLPLTMWRLPGEDPNSIVLPNTSTPKYRMASDGHLYISDFDIGDSGLYTCMGVNSGAGVMRKSKIFAVEAFPPPIIGILAQDRVISKGDTLNLP